LKRKIEHTAEAHYNAAGRALAFAVLESQLLCHAANANWPPEVPAEIQGSISPSTISPNKPVREEWDFRAKFRLPEGINCLPFDHLEDVEVVPCHDYETSREEKHWVQEALAWRDRSEDKTFGGFLRFWCHSWRTLNEKRPTTEFYVLWPEWPTVPYLKIPANVRRKRLELWTGRTFRRASKPKQFFWEVPALRVVDMTYLFSKKDIMWQKPAWYKGPFEDAIVGKTITFPGKKWNWETRELVAFDINWLESNDSLVERFRQWVEHQRKENRIEARETRGSASFPKELRSNLSALGAWRLVKKFRLNLSDAQRHTEKLSGKALFENPETWRRNLKWIISPIGILWGVDHE
jgi:hypothetical protein